MRLLLDTSVLIAGQIPAEPEVAISVVSLAELHFGPLVADETTRAQRASRLGLIEARFPDPLPLDDVTARKWGELAIAATANVHEVALLTYNAKDFKIIEDLVEVRAA